MQFNFIYITTNLINGKQYIGDHSTNNLEDNYIGSGTYLVKAIKKYGKNVFKREILEHFNTKEESFNAQEKYIKEYNTLVPNGYNISMKGGYGVPGSFLNEETRKKIGDANKISLKGYKHTKEHIENFVKHKRGIPCLEETKEKIRGKEKNKFVSNTTRKKQSDSHKGIAHSKERRERKRLKSLGENNPSAKLTNEQVKTIKTLICENAKIKEIAKMYNVSIHTIYKYKYQILNKS